MQLNIAHLCRTTVALALMAATVQAATIHPLVGDGAAMPGWTGTQSFSGPNASLTHTVTATVEYAVYAPGQFYLSNNSHLHLPPGSADPSAGLEYVYAYEIFTDSASDSISSTLSVGLFPGAVSLTSTKIKDYSFSPELGMIPQSSLSLFIRTAGVTTNAKWSFPTTPITQGNHSDIVLFTSPYGPTWHSSSITGGNSTTAVAILPSPAPEPGTIVLASFGLVGLGLQLLRRRMRRASV